MRLPQIAVLTILLAILTACGGTSSTPNLQKPSLTAIAVGPSGQSVNLGAGVGLVATASYSDGTSAAVTTTAAWTSSDTTKATVETTGQATPGLVVGVASGSATITAAIGDVSGSTTITVGSATLKTLAISPTNPTIGIGSTEKFAANGTYSDGTGGDLTATANWSSSNPSIATISTGVATGVANGSSNIQAGVGSITALTILNVSTSGGTQTGLNVSEIDPAIAPGRTLQIIAEAVFSNNSKQDVTDSATWTSTDTNGQFVTVQKGLVTGVAPTPSGTPVTITATSGGFSNTVTITVAANAKPIALMDMTSSENYLGFQGGLYANSSDTLPATHDAAGVAAAAAVTPLDQNGNANANGAVVFLGIGMSNATIEFSAFKTAMSASGSGLKPTVSLQDGAYGSVTACEWTVAQGPTTTACPSANGVPAENQYDRVRDTVLAIAADAPSAPAGCGAAPLTPCLTEAQVQVIWLKDANPSPANNSLGTLAAGTDCVVEIAKTPPAVKAEACNYEEQLGDIVRAARSRYKNLKQIFLATRIYAGYASTPLNPEPYAYEYGFSAKWLIQAQVNQETSGTADPVAGDMSLTDGKAAWTAWGPYLWADGTNARSDGLTWVPSDFQSDGTHPDPQGTQKIVNLLTDFFLTSKYTPWF